MSMESMESNLLNEKIISSHNPSLIRPNDSPNGNIIFHLYSDGTITYQKGGDAYGQRSMFDLKLGDSRLKSLFEFPLKCQDGTTYVILSEKECIEFRKEMLKFI